MGIRFRCPNGHKLNVKSFQAEMRGVCPYCGAKFTVPAESAEPPTDTPQGEEQSAETDDVSQPPPQQVAQEAAGAPPASEQPASAQPIRATKTDTTDALAQDPNALWYVRPPSGGQFGPADGNVMRDWIKDGRVTADSLVWREGWQDWVEAVTVFPRLALVRWLPDDDAAKKPPPPPAEKPRPQTQSVVEPFVETKPHGKRASLKSELAKRGGGRRRPRSAREVKNRRVTIVVGLSVVAIALAGILIWVLMR